MTDSFELDENGEIQIHVKSIEQQVQEAAEKFCAAPKGVPPTMCMMLIRSRLADYDRLVKYVDEQTDALNTIQEAVGKLND